MSGVHGHVEQQLAESPNEPRVEGKLDDFNPVAPGIRSPAHKEAMVQPFLRRLVLSDQTQSLYHAYGSLIA
jgi:hypothetical protein